MMGTRGTPGGTPQDALGATAVPGCTGIIGIPGSTGMLQEPWEQREHWDAPGALGCTGSTGTHREHRVAVRSESSSSWLPWRITGYRQRPPGEPRAEVRRQQRRNVGPRHGASLPSRGVTATAPRNVWGRGPRGGTRLGLSLQPPGMGLRPHPGSLPTGMPAVRAAFCTESPAAPKEPSAALG